mgnify:CR=1 FL=1|jgi:hypothetical protein
MDTKFDCPETEQIYHLSLDGGIEEQIGSVDEQGWYGRIGRSILTEDNFGFVCSQTWDTEEQAIEAFANIIIKIEGDDETINDD